MTFRIHRNWWGWFVVVVVLFNNDLSKPILQREGEGTKHWQTEILSLEVLHWKAAVVANIVFQECRFNAHLAFIRVKPQLRRGQGWDRELSFSSLIVYRYLNLPLGAMLTEAKVNIPLLLAVIRIISTCPQLHSCSWSSQS